MPEQQPLDLAKTPIHLQGSEALAVNNFNFDGPSFEAYVDTYCSESEPGQMMMIEITPEDWTTWECHPQGAEIVHILQGQGVFIQQDGANEIRIPIQPGSTIINPPGVWHTADIVEPVKAIYLTPCPGTQHKPRN